MTVYILPSVKDKYESIAVNIRHKKTGRGEPGAKSVGLKKHKRLIESAYSPPKSGGEECGLFNLPRSVITPLFFREFLRRAGASHDNPKSQAAIMSSKFTESEIEGIRGALQPFYNGYIAIRSDECTAAGCGLWHTGFLGYTRKTFSHALNQIKQILASEFASSTIAFKKRAGLPMEQTPGVLIQPMIMYNYSMPGDVFTTILHVNAITHFSGDRCLVNLGAGIGGANRKGALSIMLDELSESVLTRDAIRNSVSAALLMLDGKVSPVYVYGESKVMKESISNGITGLAGLIESGLKIALGKITESTSSSMYLELAWWFPVFAVLQCADLSLGQVVAPNIPYNQRIFSLHSSTGRQFGSLVSGRIVVETENIVYVPSKYQDNRSLIEQVVDLNRSLVNYVLVSEHPYDFIQKNLTFAGYSTASAMVFTSNVGPLYPVDTHFGGLLREAGIPVLAGKINDSFIRSLKPGLNKRKVLVYANDEKQEGFMASLD